MILIEWNNLTESLWNCFYVLFSHSRILCFWISYHILNILLYCGECNSIQATNEYRTLKGSNNFCFFIGRWFLKLILKWMDKLSTPEPDIHTHSLAPKRVRITHLWVIMLLCRMLLLWLTPPHTRTTLIIQASAVFLTHNVLY